MYCIETGLTEWRAVGERDRTVFQLRAFADFVSKDKWKQNVIVKAQPELRKTSIPLGPVVVFTASNFPLAFSTAGGGTVSVLAAGSPVIVKSHSMHSGTGELVASAIVKAIEKTGMPDGVFSNLTGRGRTVGQDLVKYPKIKAVGFTGSISGGRALFDIAAQRDEPIPVFAEMGSINPVVVTSNALATRSDEIARCLQDQSPWERGNFALNLV